MQTSNKIVLGTVQFGLKYGINNSFGKPGKEVVGSILDLAFKNNIRLLDTAEAYGNSQEVIGDYHRSSGNKFSVITKFSSKNGTIPGKLSVRIQEDLKILNVDSLYCYMFHSFNDFIKYFDIFKNEIIELKRAKIINRFGVSVYTSQEIAELLKYDVIDLIQFPFNLLDNNNQRSGIIKRSKDKGIEIHTRSVFLQGLFFKNTNDLSGKLVSLVPYVREVSRISKTNNIDLNALSLNYVLQQENIDNVIIGVDSVGQLQENITSLQKKVPKEVIRQIDLINVKEVDLLNPSNWNL